MWAGNGSTSEFGFNLGGKLFSPGGIAAGDEFGDERRNGFFQRLIQAADSLQSLFAIVRSNLGGTVSEDG